MKTYVLLFGTVLLVGVGLGFMGANVADISVIGEDRLERPTCSPDIPFPAFKLVVVDGGRPDGAGSHSEVYRINLYTGQVCRYQRELLPIEGLGGPVLVDGWTPIPDKFSVRCADLMGMNE